MRVTSVELHPAGSTAVQVLSFRDPIRGNPYNVKEITGLDADSIVPKYYGGSGNSSDLFYNLMLEKRNIVMRVQLNPVFAHQTYSDLRDALYKIVASSRTGLVEIQFKNETGIVAVISGWIIKVESPQFTKTPEIALTFQTQDPMLKAPNPVNVVLAGLNPADTNLQDLVSTAPHGFEFVATFIANVASVVMNDPLNPTSWSFGITPAGGFLNGDVLHFSSDPKDKQLYLVRGGVTIYLADKIAAGSMWPIMFPGDNHFALTGAANIHWTSITYTPTFWGV